MIDVREGGRRRIDRVLGSNYLRGLGELDLAELRERRDEAAQEETDLSYLRRLLHARIDIVKAEQRRRADGEEGSVLDQLPAILADNAQGAPSGKARYQPLEPSRAGVYRRQAEAIAGNSDLSDVTSLGDDELDAALATYREQEQSVSARRHEVHHVVDTLNAEIADRYARGAASVDELIGRQQAAGDERQDG